MGQLPPARVNPASTFLHTGVDYAGPIQIRTTKGRGHKSYKGYRTIFVCLSTKTVHLEVVSDMLAETFIAAFRRFTSRRGCCAHIYSDNGTTFVGAKNLMKAEVTSLLKKASIEEKLTTYGTQWHFIPPSAPHFGGLWEAAVKSTKYHMKRVIGEATLTYEELSTLTSQIEACLNSRPLCPLSDNVNDISVLSPSHFLIGRELLKPYNPVSEDYETNLSRKWKQIQKMKKDFWQVWSNEYLHQLQQRYKWQTTQENMKIGDVVLVKENNITPSKWPPAKIVDVHPDADGMVRVVSIKNPDKAVTKRPIHKVILLSED